MSLELSDDDAVFRIQLREFFTTAVDDRVRLRVANGEELSREETVATQRLLNAHGLAVPHWPAEWGGRGWSSTKYSIWRNEMQLAGVPDPLPFNIGMVGPIIAEFASQEVKDRFLPATANLDIWWCQGFSEPEAGSDLASLRTRAVRDGDHYVVRGQKTWTSYAQHADWIFCLVRTDPDAPKQRGISFLLIDMSSPGVSVRPIELFDGSQEVNEVFLDDVRVPVENLVGVENEGWTYAKYLLGLERTGVAKVGVSMAKLAQVREFASSGHGGAALLDDPLFGARLAELENEVIALEILQAQVAIDMQAGRPSPQASLLKLRGSELQQATSELLMDAAAVDGLPQPAGPTSTTTGSERSVVTYLNLRKSTIYSGSSEVQRTIIARSVLGL